MRIYAIKIAPSFAWRAATTLVGTDQPGAGAVIVGVEIGARMAGGGTVFVRVGSPGGSVRVGAGVLEGGVVMIVVLVGVRVGGLTLVGT